MGDALSEIEQSFFTDPRVKGKPEAWEKCNQVKGALEKAQKGLLDIARKFELGDLSRPDYDPGFNSPGMELWKAAKEECCEHPGQEKSEALREAWAMGRERG